MGSNQSNRDPIRCKFEGVGFEGEKEINYVAVPPHIYNPCKEMYPTSQQNMKMKYYRCIYDAFKISSSEFIITDSKGVLNRTDRIRWIERIKHGKPNPYQKTLYDEFTYNPYTTGFLMRKSAEKPIETVEIKELLNVKIENYWKRQAKLIAERPVYLAKFREPLFADFNNDHLS